MIGKWSGSFFQFYNTLYLRLIHLFLRFKRTGKRKEIFLATKFGFVMGRDGDPTSMTIRADPEYVPRALDKSLERLGVDQVDLWYLHRSVYRLAS